MSASTGGFFPENPSLGQTLQGVLHARTVDKGFIAHLSLSAAEAATASATGVHAAVTDTGVQVVVTTAITNPPYPRNITATAGGTAGDIKAITVTIAGTNDADEAITEILPAFTVDTAGIVTGAKCFKTVTSITIPAHDGVGATTAVGFGSKIGLPHKLSHNTLWLAFLANAKEGTLPTVTVSASALESNGATLNSSLNGTAVDLYYIV
jgi:hypothetical protein